MSRFLHSLVIATWLASSLYGASAASPKTVETVDFQRDVRPILSDKCFQCHGPDPNTRMADLRLDTHEGAFAERDNGVPIVPGNLQDSLLYQRIMLDDPMRRMPPAYSNKALTKEQIDVLARWIEQGATWDQHWSFQPLSRFDPPAVNNEAWVRNAIDRFVLARLEAEGLEPAPEADRRTLIRRVSLDLTGLPPSPEQVETFVNDPAANAYEKLVDRLLESPQWGEHRARYWLDAARYGDTHGLHIDNYREMWPYRDWVINAFNRNMPFDQFTIEQIAGDLLPNPTLEQRVATGFHRCNVTTNEAGIIVDEYEAVYAKDRADTTGTVWLGLTVGCATCHDHKFDPISQKDFYAITAFFRNTTQYVMDGNVADPAPVAVVPRLEDRARWEELKRKSADLQARLKRVSSAADDKAEKWLSGGKYRSVQSPLEDSSEVLKLSLGERAQVETPSGQQPIELKPGATLGPGPSDDLPALHFADESSGELPGLELDGTQPFSMALWVYQPKSDGNFVVVSQSDPNDKGRGWAIDINARVAGFHMIGDEPEGESYTKGVEIRAGHLQQLEVGTWSHITITYDGSGERAGLNFYLNGEVIPTQGSEYFTKLKGTMRTGRPILLGKELRKENEDDRHFAGGAIADFRVFNREVTVEEARLVSQWPMLRKAIRKQPGQLTAAERDALRLYHVSLKNDKYRRLVAEMNELEREQREIRRRGGVTHVMQERADSQPFAHILYRGMYDRPKDRVEPDTPAALSPMPASFPRNRLGLAKWLVDDSNPLTARVTVNRFWQQVFGTGVVETADDFGSQGALPSHPKLLDWLGSEFQQSGWDVKGFFRLMVTSAAYRQAAVTTPEKLEKDPANRLLSRGPRFRMDGEVLRDYSLAASGLLVPKIGGPSVKPYQPEGVWETVAMLGSNTRHYKQDHGDKLYRRSLYTFWKRAAPPASMEVFNAPTRENCTVQRERTNTPLQALVTMNDPQFVEANRHLAQRALREGGDDFDSRLDYITGHLMARPLEDKERTAARRAYDDFIAYYENNEADAGKLLATGESEADSALPQAEFAAWTMVANQVMNLDEVLNK